MISMERKIEVLGSTDVTGVRIRPDIFRKVYAPALSDGVMVGAEMIALVGLDKRLEKFQRDGIKTYSLHGRTGIPDTSEISAFHRLFLRFENRCIVSTKDLTKSEKFAGMDILIHVPEIQNIESHDAIVASSKENPHRRFWVENHSLGISGIDTAVCSIFQLQQSGCINVAFMFDPSHFVGVEAIHNSHFLKAWNKMMDELKDFQVQYDCKGGHKQIHWGLHFAIGTYEDALPVDVPEYREVILESLKELLYSDILGCPAERIVFEYLHRGTDMALPDRQVERDIKRFEEIYKDCRRCGVI